MARTKGMWFYEDWLESFSEIPPGEFKKLFIAMMDYSLNGKEPPQFKGVAKVVASFIFPQLKRSRQGAENGAKGGNPNLIGRLNQGLNPPLNQGLNESEEMVEPRVEDSKRKRKEAKEKEYTDTDTDTDTDTVVVGVCAPAPARDEQQQQSSDYTFVGTHKNIRVRKSWFKAFNAKYAYAKTAIDYLSEYKKKKDITSSVKDEQYLEEWAETDREKFEHMQLYTSSFDTDEFFQSALKRSYGK